MLPQFCTVYISAEGMRTHCSILQKDRCRHSDETSRSAQVQQKKTRLEAMKSQRLNFSPELVFCFPSRKPHLSRLLQHGLCIASLLIYH